MPSYVCYIFRFTGQSSVVIWEFHLEHDKSMAVTMEQSISTSDVGSLSTLIPPKPDIRRKKLKLELKPPPTTDIAKLRQQICDHKRRCQEQLNHAYRDNLTELFYLQNGINYMDIATWRKKPNANLNHYLKGYSLDPEDEPVVKPEPASIPVAQKNVEILKSESRRPSISR